MFWWKKQSSQLGFFAFAARRPVPLAVPSLKACALTGGR
jgi:hypothetical protein